MLLAQTVSHAVVRRLAPPESLTSKCDGPDGLGCNQRQAQGVIPEHSIRCPYVMEEAVNALKLSDFAKVMWA